MENMAMHFEGAYLSENILKDLLVLNERQESWECSSKISQHSKHFSIHGGAYNAQWSLKWE